MPRRRRTSTDVSRLEEELNELKERQTELRQAIRRLKNSQGEIAKLEEKLSKQFATAKWTVGQIRELQPEYDDIAFYQNVDAKRPTPRGRRPRTAPEAQ